MKNEFENLYKKEMSDESEITSMRNNFWRANTTSRLVENDVFNDEPDLSDGYLTDAYLTGNISDLSGNEYGEKSPDKSGSPIYEHSRRGRFNLWRPYFSSQPVFSTDYFSLDGEYIYTSTKFYNKMRSNPPELKIDGDYTDPLGAIKPSPTVTSGIEVGRAQNGDTYYLKGVAMENLITLSRRHISGFFYVEWCGSLIRVPELKGINGNYSVKCIWRDEKITKDIDICIVNSHMKILPRKGESSKMIGEVYIYSAFMLIKLDGQL
jgi:hypothetical protein